MGRVAVFRVTGPLERSRMCRRRRMRTRLHERFLSARRPEDSFRKTSKFGIPRIRWSYSCYVPEFFEQVLLACQIKKPVILREKGAHKDVMEVLQKYRDLLPTLVLHSFIGSLEEATSYLQMDNTYIAVSGMILYFNFGNV